MSTMNINQFWLKQSNLFSWNKKPSIAFKKKKNNFVEWYPDGKINYYYNCITKNIESGLGNKIAIHTVTKEKKFSKVLKLGTKLLKKKPNDFDLLYVLGFSSIDLQNFIDAEKFFRKILSFKKSADIFYIYGNIQSKLKNYKEATSSFENAINLNPNFSEAYNNLGNVNKLNNQIQEAIKNYKKSIDKKNDNITAYFNLAVIFKEIKKYKDSKNVYEKILEIDKNNLTAKHDLGAVNSILGNFEKAREYFIEAISINNKNFKSYKNYIEITKIIEGDHIFKSLENISAEDTNDQNKIDIFYSLSKGYFDQQKNKFFYTFK